MVGGGGDKTKGKKGKERKLYLCTSYVTYMPTHETTFSHHTQHTINHSIWRKDLVGQLRLLYYFGMHGREGKGREAMDGMSVFHNQLNLHWVGLAMEKIGKVVDEL